MLCAVGGTVFSTPSQFLVRYLFAFNIFYFFLLPVYVCMFMTEAGGAGNSNKSASHDTCQKHGRRKAPFNQNDKQIVSCSFLPPAGFSPDIYREREHHPAGRMNNVMCDVEFIINRFNTFVV